MSPKISQHVRFISKPFLSSPLGAGQEIAMVGVDEADSPPHYARTDVLPRPNRKGLAHLFFVALLKNPNLPSEVV